VPDQEYQNQLNAALQPKVEELTMDAKLTGTMSALKEQLAKVPFYLLNADEKEINLVKVESRNINKRPYLFHIITLNATNVTVTYSYLPDSSLNLRRAAVLKNLSGILSLVSDQYNVNSSKFLQYVDSVLDSLTAGLSQNYTTLYNRYDAMLTEYRDLKRLNIELAASNRNLTIQSAQLSDENKSLSTQISILKKYSDESLMALVEEWIQVHNNSIDVVEFGKSHDVMPTRVEQILDKMISLGYIELKT
jgi:hypothetical protein